MTQSQHIIIVDDEAPAREMVGDYLKMHGFTVTLCDGGKSLRGVIETNVPDLVVLDLNMPEEDGLSIIRDATKRLTSMVDHLISDAMADAFDITIRREPVDVAALVTEVTDANRSRSAGAARRRRQRASVDGVRIRPVESVRGQSQTGAFARAAARTGQCARR